MRRKAETENLEKAQKFTHSQTFKVPLYVYANIFIYVCIRVNCSRVIYAVCLK